MTKKGKTTDDSLRRLEPYGRTRGGVTESYLTDALGSTVKRRDGAQAKSIEYTYAAGNHSAIGGSLAHAGLPQASNYTQYDANNRLISRDGIP
ncbi:MAG: hypothetical protein ACREYF_11340 [Gammaproteobacteria bacterium]